VTPEIPISDGQTYAAQGGELLYVVDAVAGRELLAQKKRLAERGVRLKDLRRR
jgi:glucosamine-6-phosphate deaminase